MRLPLTTLEIFTAIAKGGSLKAAADALGLRPSTVSHQLKALEAQLGVSLFVRTTRAVNLTEAGRTLFEGAGPAFAQLSDAVARARETGVEPRGALKLALPEFAYHLVVAPIAATFRARHPAIELELSFDDALSDIASDGFHAGFRLGDLVAPDMIARRLTPPLELAVVGAPRYFAERGVPERPRDLLRHERIRYRFRSSGRIAPWRFAAGPDTDGAHVIGGPDGLVVDSLAAALDLSARGLGLVYTFRDYCAPALARGDLVAVLDDHLPKTAGLFIYFPREYRRMAPLRAFVDHLEVASTI